LALRSIPRGCCNRRNGSRRLVAANACIALGTYIISLAGDRLGRESGRRILADHDHRLGRVVRRFSFDVQLQRDGAVAAARTAPRLHRIVCALLCEQREHCSGAAWIAPYSQPLPDAGGEIRREVPRPRPQGSVSRYRHRNAHRQITQFDHFRWQDPVLRCQAAGARATGRLASQMLTGCAWTVPIIAGRCLCTRRNDVPIYDAYTGTEKILPILAFTALDDRDRCRGRRQSGQPRLVASTVRTMVPRFWIAG